MTGAAKSAEGKQRVIALVDSAQARSHPLTFWWRDDDAVDATPALDRMLALRARHGVPLALAVIPAHATPALADRLAEEPRVAALQHGWSHASHAAAGAKNIELDGERPLATVLDELRRGFDRLGALMPDRFLPVLVPPWNRIADRVRDARREVGLQGLSTSGHAPTDAHCVNIHLDIFDRRPTRPKPRADIFSLLADEIERRLEGESVEPIGIMTHHLVHEDENWAALEEILGLLARHPAVRWPATKELFGFRDEAPLTS